MTLIFLIFLMESNFPSSLLSAKAFTRIGPLGYKIKYLAILTSFLSLQLSLASVHKLILNCMLKMEIGLRPLWNCYVQWPLVVYLKLIFSCEIQHIQMYIVCTVQYTRIVFRKKSWIIWQKVSIWTCPHVALYVHSSCYLVLFKALVWIPRL